MIPTMFAVTVATRPWKTSLLPSRSRSWSALTVNSASGSSNLRPYYQAESRRVVWTGPGPVQTTLNIAQRRRISNDDDDDVDDK